MTLIPDELIERIRDSADIVEIVGEQVDLRKTGSDYRGPCPFHGGSHRNLAVIPRKQMFYCFVCHEGGDVFSFFMKQVGLDYPQAVRHVAERVGVEIPERPTGGPDPNEPLYSATAIAAEWYARRLRESDDAGQAREYLEGRKYDLDALAPWGLGFAPKGDAFLKAMAELGIGEDTLLNAGLALRREDNTLRPRFWGRLLFPIHDIRGRVVAFGGRVLGDGEPKYLNSADSRIFHKGRMLYNLHQARHAIRKADRAIVVEGYFDVIRMVDAGVENVVAGLGTAFTTDQAKLIKRYAPEAVMFYDSDPAGLRATFRTADELLRASVRTSIATAPPGEDPDTLILKEGSAGLMKVVDDAIDVFERKLQLLERKGWLDSLNGKRRSLDRLLPTLRAVGDPVTRDLYVSRTAQMLGIQEDSIHREIAGGRRSGPPKRVAAAEPNPATSRQRGTSEWRLLEVMVHEPEWRPKIGDVLQETAWVNTAEREVFELLRAASPDMTGGELLEHLGPEAQTILGEILGRPWEDGLNVDAIVDGAVDRIRGRELDDAISERERRLPLVPAGAEKDELVREISDLTQKKRELKRPSWFR